MLTMRNKTTHKNMMIEKRRLLRMTLFMLDWDWSGHEHSLRRSWRFGGGGGGGIGNSWWSWNWHGCWQGWLSPIVVTLKLMKSWDFTQVSGHQRMSFRHMSRSIGIGIGIQHATLKQHNIPCYSGSPKPNGIHYLIKTQVHDLIITPVGVVKG